jgi:hypothetical protein
VEQRTIVYDEVTSYELGDDIYEPVLADIEDVLPFSVAAKHYLVGIKNGRSPVKPMRSGENKEQSMLDVSEEAVDDMEPVTNKREARRMSKSIVGNIMRRASIVQYTPEQLAAIPSDRLSTIPELFKDSSTEDFTIQNYPKI